jgi:hypothetical protein
MKRALPASQTNKSEALISSSKYLGPSMPQVTTKELINKLKTAGEGISTTS